MISLVHNGLGRFMMKRGRKPVKCGVRTGRAEWKLQRQETVEKYLHGDEAIEESQEVTKRLTNLYGPV